MDKVPDFRSPEFLREHILHTMAFYDGRALDPTGGFFHHFKDDGTVYDRSTRHLVSSTRFVITHAMAARHFPHHPRARAWRDAAEHGLQYLQRAHRDPASGHYAWILHHDGSQPPQVLDATRHAYGLAFVVLAQAHALMAGIESAHAGLVGTVELMDAQFWEPALTLYADEATPAGELSSYRGQNANMHACEAFLAAHEATGNAAYLARAASIADAVTQGLAAHGDGLIWEHYRSAGRGPWEPDWDYNRGDRTNIFRPWGFQTGHLTEWAKLLVTLEPRLPGLPRDDNWLLHRARELFAAAVQHGWDRQHDGLAYGFAPDPEHRADPKPRMTVCDGDKYFWVQAESLAAAALLAVRLGDGGYWGWYDRLWQYAWQHFVDHRHGAWFRILSPDNRRITDKKSPAGKTDYHTMGACYDVLRVLQ
jgi:mannose/cellobiose epimerase-like protein (N-acyl-D-glucosamine 2-epimerase family)